MTAPALEQRIAREGVPGAWCGDVWIPGRAPGERRNLTDPQKQAILAWLPDHSWTEALTVYGVYSATIINWRKQTTNPKHRPNRPSDPKPQHAGRPSDPYGCACGDRYPTHDAYRQHYRTAVKGRHRLVDSPYETPRMLGAVRSPAGHLNRPEAVHVVRPHTARDWAL